MKTVTVMAWLLCWTCSLFAHVLFRKTGVHPGSRPGQAFCGTCASMDCCGGKMLRLTPKQQNGRPRMSRIGFIGLGNMGLPMGQNLIKAGHRVEGVDMSGVQTGNWRAAGAAAAETPKIAAARGDVVITMLPAGQHV